MLEQAHAEAIDELPPARDRGDRAVAEVADDAEAGSDTDAEAGSDADVEDGFCFGMAQPDLQLAGL